MAAATAASGIHAGRPPPTDPLEAARARAASAEAAAADSLHRAEVAEASAAAAAAETASLRAAVAALEARAEAVERREASHQHRLRVFERMEPIFDRVATWQRFAGAEVMERMDTLENMRDINSFADLKMLLEK